MRDRCLRRSAGAAVGAADQHHVGVCFGNARRNGPHPDFRDQLDADARIAIGVLQIVNQLGEIFDGIDIVVRRRRDESHARRGVPRLRNPRIHFASRKLSALAGFCPLRHLDLQFLGADQVLAGHTKAARRHLFDGGIFRIAIRHPNITLGIFAALAGVALAANAIHRNRQRFVGFFTDGAVRHGAGLEAFQNTFDRLNFINRNRITGLEVQQTTQRRKILRLIVDQRGVGHVSCVAARAHRLLQAMNGLGIEEMKLAVGAPLVLSAHGQHWMRHRFTCWKRGAMPHQHFLRNHFHANAADTRGCAGKIFFDDLFVQAHGFEHLRAVITLYG